MAHTKGKPTRKGRDILRLLQARPARALPEEVRHALEQDLRQRRWSARQEALLACIARYRPGLLHQAIRRGVKLALVAGQAVMTPAMRAAGWRAEEAALLARYADARLLERARSGEDRATCLAALRRLIRSRPGVRRAAAFDRVRAAGGEPFPWPPPARRAKPGGRQQR